MRRVAIMCTVLCMMTTTKQAYSAQYHINRKTGENPPPTGSKKSGENVVLPSFFEPFFVTRKTGYLLV